MRKQKLQQCAWQSRPHSGRRCLQEAPMTEQASKPPRKPFGYDPTVVDQMLSDRDAMLGLAERRVRDAEAKTAQLEEQLRAQQQAVAELSEQLAVAESSPPPAPEPAAEPEPAPKEEEP